MKADVVLSLRALGPDNLTVRNDVHVVLPSVVSAPLTEVHASHGRLAENFGYLFCPLFTMGIHVVPLSPASTLN